MPTKASAKSAPAPECADLSVPVSGRAFAVELTPPSVSPALMAVGMAARVAVVQLAFPEERRAGGDDAGAAGDDGAFRALLLREVDHDGRVQSLAWPHFQLPEAVVFAAGGADGKVRVFSLGLGGEGDRVVTLGGHTDYVNAVAFQPVEVRDAADPVGLLASGSDDCSLLLHNLDAAQADEGDGRGDLNVHHSIAMSSPVMAVKWHPAEESKLLAAEKAGTIHILNSVTFNPIQSLDCGLGPLSDVDWSLRNSLLVATAIRTEVYVWDVSRPSAPIVKRTAHEQGVRTVRFSPSFETVVATHGQPNYTVKVTDVKSSQILFSDGVKPIGGVAWHPRLPYLMVGRDQHVAVHRIRI